MRSTYLQKDGHEFFDDISEVYDYIVKNPLESRSDLVCSPQSCSSVGGDIDWAGESIDKCLELMIDGDEDTANKVFKSLSDEVVDTKHAIQYFNDVLGVLPNVPNTIMGLPQNMINVSQNKIKTQNKILNIVVETSVNGSISISKFLKCSTAIMSRVDSLEKQGYRCNLYFSICSGYYHNSMSWLIKLKSQSEPFNLYKNAFVLGNIGMLRRISFRLNEITSCPFIEGKGREYGRAVSDEDIDVLVRDNLYHNSGIKLPNLKVLTISGMLGISNKNKYLDGKLQVNIEEPLG